jgi:hypothetical protein
LYHHVVGTVLTAKYPLNFSVICTLFDANSDDASGAILENHGRVLIMYRIRGAAIVVRIYKPASAIMSPRERGVHQMQDEKSLGDGQGRQGPVIGNNLSVHLLLGFDTAASTISNQWT